MNSRNYGSFIEEAMEMLNDLERPDTSIEEYDKVITFLRGWAYNETNHNFKMTLLTAITIIETRKRIIRTKKENEQFHDTMKSEINNILWRLSSLEKNSKIQKNS
ncbi:MAG: hypothetical protein ACE5RN_01030 [Nitrosopumilaceae archaeon]